jgi:hypothetical protein
MIDRIQPGDGRSKRGAEERADSVRKVVLELGVPQNVVPARECSQENCDSGSMTFQRPIKRGLVYEVEIFTEDWHRGQTVKISKSTSGDSV